MTLVLQCWTGFLPRLLGGRLGSSATAQRTPPSPAGTAPPPLAADGNQFLASNQADYTSWPALPARQVGHGTSVHPDPSPRACSELGCLEGGQCVADTSS